LAAVHGTLVAHRGAIRIETNVDQGTTFWLWIPRQPSRTIRPQAKTLPQARCRGLRVLVVDDEPVARITAGHLLETLGHFPMMAIDGVQGLDCFKRDHAHIDLVLLDSIMPNLSGTEVFRRMREACPEVPIVLVSGFARDDLVEVLMAEGLEAFLMKPYTRANLISVINTAFDRKSKRCSAASGVAPIRASM
jgi:two-component system cell cycle sensor histidine kinase/response regulator CckA